MMIALYRHDYPTFLLEGQKTAAVMKDPVLADIVASARAGYGKSGSRGLMERLYAAQKGYFLQGKFDATMLAETCVLMGRRQEALQLLDGACNRHEANLLCVPVPPRPAHIERRSRLQGAGEKNQLSGRFREGLANVFSRICEAAVAEFNQPTLIEAWMALRPGWEHGLAAVERPVSGFRRGTSSLWTRQLPKN